MKNLNLPQLNNIYIKLFLILSLVFIRNVLNIEFPVIIILLVFITIALLSESNDIICLGICCIPLSTAFQYKYALLFCCLILIFKHRDNLKINPIIYPLILMIVWELLHAFYGFFSIIEYFRGSAEIIFLISILLTCDRDSFDYKNMVRSFAFTTVMICSILLLISLSNCNYNFKELFNGSYRFGNRINEEEFALNFNPNRLGFICNLSIVGIIQCINNKNNKPIDYILLFFTIFFGILTLSRAFILSFSLVVLVSLLLKKGTILEKTGRVFATVMLLLLVFFIFSNFFPFVIDKFLDRFKEEDISNGRIDLFAFYNRHLLSRFDYLFFGLGVQNFTLKINTIYNGDYINTHNGFQEVLLSWGIIGLIFLLVFLYMMIRESIHINHKLKILNLLPLIFLLINTQAGQMISSGVIMLAFSFIYLSLTNNFNHPSKISNFGGIK